MPLHLGKVKFRARHPAVDVLDVVAGALKVGGGVVRAGDEDLQSDGFSAHACVNKLNNRGRSYLALRAQVRRLVLVGDADKLLVDGHQKVQGGLDLLLGVICLHRRADDGDVFALRRHVVSKGDHAHVDVWKGRGGPSTPSPRRGQTALCFPRNLTVLPLDLILGDDDLAGVGVAGVGDGVAQDADHADHLAHFLDPVGNVAGVTDELLASGNL